MVVHVTRSATLRTRKMLFARGNRIFLCANGFDFFFSCLKVCKLTRATVCIYICNLVFVHFERHTALSIQNFPRAPSVNLQISFAAFVSFSTFLLLEKRKAQKAEKLIGLLKYLKTFWAFWPSYIKFLFNKKSWNRLLLLGTWKTVSIFWYWYRDRTA